MRQEDPKILKALQMLPERVINYQKYMASFRECSKATNTDSHYLKFRKRFFSEAHFYSQYILPYVCDLLQSVMSTLSVVQAIGDPVGSTYFIKRSVSLCRADNTEADRLQRQHNSVISRIMDVERDIKSWYATCEKEYTERRRRSKYLATSFAIIWVITRPFVGLLLFSIIGLLFYIVYHQWIYSSSEAAAAERITESETLLLNLQNLAQLFKHGKLLVVEITEVLDLVKKEIFFIYVGDGELPVETFFRPLKNATEAVFTECENMITCGVECKKTMNSFKSFIEKEDQLEWLADIGDRDEGHD